MESDQKLANILRDGRWSMLIGHRQSGKTTTGIAARQLLAQQHPLLEVYHITLTSPIVAVDDLWTQIHDRLHSLNPGRFPKRSFNYAERKFEFEAMFSPSSPQSGKVSLILDEAGLLDSMEGLDTFLTVMRMLRDQRPNGFSLHSLVLMGTEALKWAVSPESRSGKLLNYSPFSLVRGRHAIYLCCALAPLRMILSFDVSFTSLYLSTG